MKSNIERELEYDGRTCGVGCFEHGDEHFDFIRI
jgi:hypothetical protein